MEDKKIQWHPGFVAAMNLELAGNREDLVFEKEYNLNTKPLEIDLLVIRKNRDAVITNEIGRLFRRHNIMEYKSPLDRLDIDTLYKTVAYACLYKSYGKTVDDIPAEEITVSIVREAKPEGLFRLLARRGTAVERAFPGIYYIQQGFLFPVQVIVTRELNREGHAWLRALSKNMGSRDMRELVEMVYRLTGKFDRELADSVLEVSMGANRDVIEKLKGDERMCQALLEIMKPELEELEQKWRREERSQAMQEGIEKGIEEGIEKGIRNTVETLRSLGHNDEEIKKAVMRQYGLFAEEMEKYL